MRHPDDLVVSLARAYGLNEILSDDDRRFREAVESARALLEEEGAAELEVREDSIRVDGSSVDDPHGFVGELARDLDATGVRRVTLSGDVSLEGVLSFLRGLREGAGSGQPGRTEATYREGLEGIDVAFEDGDDEGKAPDRGLGSVFQPGAAEPADEEPTDAPAPEPTDAPAPEPTDAPSPEPIGEGAPTASDPPAPDADASLPNQVDEFLGAERARRDDLSERLEAAAASLRREGRLDAVADAVERLVSAAQEGAGDPEALTLAREMVAAGVAARLAVRLGEARDEEERQRLIRVAADLGQPMAEPVAEALADTSDRAARRAYIETLVALDEPGGRQAERMIEDRRWFVVRNGVSILGELGGDRAVEHLTSALGHDDPRVRREAVMALARLGGEDAGDLVVGMVDDPDPDVRAAVAMALGVLKVERAVKPLMQRLEQEDEEDVQVQIIRALGALGDPGAVPAIEKRAVASFFSRPPRPVRIAAYKALSDIGTPHAREVVEDASEDRDPEVRETVQGLLRSREE